MLVKGLLQQTVSDKLKRALLKIRSLANFSCGDLTIDRMGLKGKAFYVVLKTVHPHLYRTKLS